MKRILFVPFLVCLSIGLQAQTDLVLENNPPRIKWDQINTRDFRILFPRGFDVQGQRMASTLQHIHEAEAKSLGSRPRKISVVLQNQSAASNGFVSMLPRRSEFYTMPSQNYNFLGTNDWLNLLASHEYRHIVQYQHALTGFNSFLYYVFGPVTFTGMTQAAAPKWFFEGDAVATETAFTSSGRGRLPNFSLAFRTNLMEGREFNYHKQYLRSYKNFIPDHYVLGYHMVSYLRQRTKDPEIWGKITERSWNIPFIPFRFSSSIRNKTGLYVNPLYREMVKDLKQQWQKEIDQLQLTPFEKVSIRSNKAYTDYLYPQVMDDGSIVALKRGIGDIEQFVKISNGEQRVFTPGIYNETGMISSSGSSVLWNEFGFSPRWGVRNFSQIKIYDEKTRKKRVIGGKHDRLSGSSFSPDGKRIVTARSDNNYKNTLLIVNAATGVTEKEVSDSDNSLYSMPRWTPDGKSIVVLKTYKNKRSVVMIDAASASEQSVVPPGEENIGYPVLYENYLLFNSPITGIDNIYAIDLQSKTRYQVTSSKYGSYNPAVSKDGKTLFYNEQGKDGMDIVKTGFNPSAWKTFSPSVYESPLAANLVEQEGHPHLFDSIPQTKLSVKKYSRLKGIINPYSWGPYVDYNLIRADIGIRSQDILSTTSLSAGYSYDINEQTGLWNASLSYQGWFPIIDVKASQGERNVNEGAATFYDTLTNPVSTVKRDVIFKWSEKTIEAGLRIPLITTRSKYRSSFTIQDHVGFTQVYDFRNNIDGGGRIVLTTDSTGYFFRDYADNGNLTYNHFGIQAYRLLKTSYRDINSKFGQVLYVNLYNTLPNGDFTGRNFSVYATLYFPGLFKHHSFWGYWAYQNTFFEQEADNYIFRNTIPIPRGLSVSRFQDFYSMSANYTLPVWYPDLSLGPILNFQRVRLNTFFDYGFGQSVLYGESATYMSVGGEVKFDINIMRFLPQLDIGFRYSYGIQPSVTKFEFLLGTFRL